MTQRTHEAAGARGSSGVSVGNLALLAGLSSLRARAAHDSYLHFPELNTAPGPNGSAHSFRMSE